MPDTLLSPKISHNLEYSTFNPIRTRRISFSAFSVREGTKRQNFESEKIHSEKRCDAGLVSALKWRYLLSKEAK